MNRVNHDEKEFSDWKCDPDTHHLDLANITLSDGTLVRRRKCTRKLDGFIEIIENPCVSHNLHLGVPEYFYTGNDRINCQQYYASYKIYNANWYRETT